MQNRKKALVYTFLCIVVWSLIPVAAKLGQSNLDSHQYLFWSSLVSYITLLLVTILNGKQAYLFSYTLKELGHISFLGLLGTYIYYLLLYIGYSKSGGLEILITQYTWPFLIVVLSVTILGERLNKFKFISVCLGFIGVSIVLSRGDFNNLSFTDPFILFLVFAGAFCFALFSVLSKKVKKEPLGVTAIYFLTALIASFISMILLSGIKFPELYDWISIFINGVFINGLSYLWWIRALKLADASFLAPFIYIVPVLSAILLVIFFGEPLLVSTIIGFAMVIVGGLINR